ncbi:MAG: protein translocase subunit SecF [bacterium]|nr:protein translocase subunit SecF [bacterium]
MLIIKYRNFFFILPALLVLASLFFIFYLGIPIGIDFKGGSLSEIRYTEERPPINEIEVSVKKLDVLGEVRIQPIGEKNIIIRSRALEASEKEELLGALASGGEKIEEIRATTIGPTMGRELRTKAAIAIILVVIAIILYITVTFRHVSKPVASWKYGVISIITLFHDAIIPAGVFAVLGKFQGVEADSLFIVALLTILGISINDTIVVFDRIRENLKLKISPDYAETVGTSLNETFVRSFNTSFTVILVLLSLYFFGPSTIKTFSLMLSVGMIAGTYSSLFLASPLLVVAERLGKRRR